jgi:hypothetical protein
MVVLPAASRPTIKIRISFLPQSLSNNFENVRPMIAVKGGVGRVVRWADNNSGQRCAIKQERLLHVDRDEYRWCADLKFTGCLRAFRGLEQRVSCGHFVLGAQAPGFCMVRRQAKLTKCIRNATGLTIAQWVGDVIGVREGMNLTMIARPTIPSRCKPFPNTSASLLSR